MASDCLEPRILKGTEVLPPMEEGACPSLVLPAQAKGPGRGKRNKGRTAGRFQIINLFLDATAQTLTPSQALVWVILWRDTKPEGTARTSCTDLARRAGVGLSTAKRAVKALTRRGLLTVIYRGSLRRGPSAYRVHALPKDVG